MQQKDILNDPWEDENTGRNEHNMSGIMKSWSENISNILEATFKDDDEKGEEENVWKNGSEQYHYISNKKVW